MNVAIVHYHLNRGGVSQVIANHLAALDCAAEGTERLRVAVLYGGRAEGWPDDLPRRLKRVELTLCPVEGLDYDTQPVDQSGVLAVRLGDRLRELGFGSHSTLIHVHNHSLGKNVSLPGALAHLAAEGFPLLVQIHDFVEDYRAANYRRFCEALGERGLAAALYPQASHIHYAVLNGHDHAILHEAGVPPERLHLLPNPITGPPALPPRKEALRRVFERFGISPSQRLALYPVRGIRRKALGETLLWSLLAGPRWEVGVTLSPASPAERPQYEYWKSLAADLRLACHFAMGEEGGLPLADNLAASDAVLTTSVAEGFGMAFLEPWLAGRPLVGRRLPEVTCDFEDAGLVLNRLYRSMRVPVSWIDREQFLFSLEYAYGHVLAAYDRPRPEPDEIRPCLAARAGNGTVDFADLDEPRQAHIIQHTSASLARRRELLDLNPTVASITQADFKRDEATIRHNRQIVSRDYGPHRIGRKLRDIYHRVLASRRTDGATRPLCTETIFRRMLGLERFRPLRG